MEKYEYIARTFNLPCGRTINNFSSPSTNSPDGILFDSLKAEKNRFDNKFPGCGEKDWRRHGVLAWDSMSVKEGVVFNPHSMRIVGFASDAFDLDVIKREMAKLNDLESNVPRQPPLAKHFLVFIFTTWEIRNCPKFSIVAARYATLSLDANFLHDKILQVSYSKIRPSNTKTNNQFANTHHTHPNTHRSVLVCHSMVGLQMQ